MFTQKPEGDFMKHSLILFLCILPLQAISLATLQEECNNQGIQYIEYYFTDPFGNSKSILRPVEYLAQDYHNPIMIDGSSIKGCNRITNSDLMLKPDFNAPCYITPWSYAQYPTLRIISQLYQDPHTPYHADCRALLQQALARAQAMGYDFLVGPELEFYLFDHDNNPIDRKTYCDAYAHAAHLEPFFLSLIRDTHIDAEKAHHEVGPGQYEVSLHYGDALTIADHIIMTRDIIHFGAQLLTMQANFNPKPVAQAAGNGMHLHFSLRDRNTKKNIFADGDSTTLSDCAQSFIAGVLNRIQESAVMINSTTNSYERLVPGYEAPVYICAGYKNRSALIRIPDVIQDQPHSVRAEIRCPDGKTNPYLALAVLLQAGLDGIEHQEKLDAFVQENVYEYSSGARRHYNIKTLPTSLEQAVHYAQNSSFLKRVLGPVLFEEYLAEKYDEASGLTE